MNETNKEVLELLLGTNKNTGKLAEKLAKLQATLKGVSQNGAVTGGASYSFAKDTDVQEKVAQKIAAEGILMNLSIVPGSTVNKPLTLTTNSGKEKTKWIFSATMHYQFILGDEIIQGFFPIEGSQFDDPEKGMGTALTYSKRFFLIKYFHIGTNEGDEDEKTSTKTAKVSENTIVAKTELKVETPKIDGNQEAQKSINDFLNEAKSKIASLGKTREESQALLSNVKQKLKTEMDAVNKTKVSELSLTEATAIVQKLTGGK